MTGIITYERCDYTTMLLQVSIMTSSIGNLKVYLSAEAFTINTSEDKIRKLMADQPAAPIQGVTFVHSSPRR